MAAPSVTVVCASAAPFKELPELKVIVVLMRKTPSTWEVVPKTAAPDTYQ